MASPRRGDLYYVDWNPARGSEPAGIRPALVISTDAGNLAIRYPNVVIATVSTSGRDIPFHIRVEPDVENGLRETSYVKCEQIMTISKERLERRLGRVTEATMGKVDVGIMRVLSLPLPPEA